LKGNGSESPVALGDFNSFFGFYCLMKTVRITPSVENTPCKFIDNLNLSVFYYIIDINMKKKVRF